MNEHRWVTIDDALDARFGAGKWHCDDIWRSREAELCVLEFLAVARAPAIERMGKPQPPLFATFEGKRVRVVMASRFGDVGITEDLTADHGYSRRVYLPELSDFSGEAS